MLRYKFLLMFFILIFIFGSVLANGDEGGNGGSSGDSGGGSGGSGGGSSGDSDGDSGGSGSSGESGSVDSSKDSDDSEKGSKDSSSSTSSVPVASDITEDDKKEEDKKDEKSEEKTESESTNVITDEFGKKVTVVTKTEIENGKQETTEIRTFTDDRGNLVTVEIKNELNDGKQETREIITFVDESGREVLIDKSTEIKDGEQEFKNKISVGGVEAVSKLEIERDENGAGKIKIKLSDGNSQLINILPDRASDLALELLNTEGVNLVLDEFEQEDGQLKTVYTAQVNGIGKILGIFDVKLDLRANIDSQNAEVLDVQKPWWFFLVTGLVKPEPIPTETLQTNVQEKPITETVIA